VWKNQKGDGEKDLRPQKGSRGYKKVENGKQRPVERRTSGKDIQNDYWSLPQFSEMSEP
jgi:hypothetical protein